MIPDALGVATNCLLTWIVVSETPLLVSVNKVLILLFGNFLIAIFLVCSFSFARFLTMFAVVIASVAGAALNDIAVDVNASTTLSSVAPAVPVGITTVSPTITSLVSKPDTPIKLSVPDVSVL